MRYNSWQVGLFPDIMGQLTDRAVVSRWLAEYEAAWRAPGIEGLVEIFPGDATYRLSPMKSPSSAWIRSGGCGMRKGTARMRSFTLATEILAVDGPTGVVRAEVHYGDPVRQEYRDLWIMQIGDDGRCNSFEEWPYWPGRPCTASGG